MEMVLARLFSIIMHAMTVYIEWNHCSKETTFLISYASSTSITYSCSVSAAARAAMQHTACWAIEENASLLLIDVVVV